MTMIGKALTASALGSIVGVVFGLWSVYHYPASAASGPGGSGPLVPPTSIQAAAVVQPASAAQPVSRAQESGSDDVILRARALAEQPDVHALLALREQTVQGATQQGTGESADTKRLVAEIDRSLAKARALRLALDRAEFLKAGETGAPPETKRK